MVGFMHDRGANYLRRRIPPIRPFGFARALLHARAAPQNGFSGEGQAALHAALLAFGAQYLGFIISTGPSPQSITTTRRSIPTCEPRGPRPPPRTSFKHIVDQRANPLVYTFHPPAHFIQRRVAFLNIFLLPYRSLFPNSSSLPYYHIRMGMRTSEQIAGVDFQRSEAFTPVSPV
jgi:hypothetical protein